MFSVKLIGATKVTKCMWTHANKLSTNGLRFSTSRVIGMLNSIFQSPRCVLLNFNSLEIMFLDRYYTDKHEWIDVKGTIGTVGISQYAQVTIFK